MGKKLYIIGTVICLATVAWGYTHFDFQQYLYRLKNGPPLVTDGFAKQIRKAMAKDPKFTEKYHICSTAENSFSITDSENDYMIYAELEKNNKFYISESLNKRDPFILCDFNSPRATDLNKTALNKFDNVPIVELNRMIDKKIFNDVKTRAEKKQKILRKIEELQQNN